MNANAPVARWAGDGRKLRLFDHRASADSEPIHAGKDEFARALALIKESKKLRYEGVIGPISFEQYGDITGPFRLWCIKDGEVTTVGEMSTEEVAKIKAGLK